MSNQVTCPNCGYKIVDHMLQYKEHFARYGLEIVINCELCDTEVPTQEPKEIN